MIRYLTYNLDKTKFAKKEVGNRTVTINNEESQKAGAPSKVGTSGSTTRAVVSRVGVSVSIIGIAVSSVELSDPLARSDV